MAIRLLLINSAKLVLLAFSWPSIATGVEPTQYEVSQEIYISGVYNSRSDRRISPTTAVAYLEPELFARTSWIAFRCRVRAGTRITVEGKAESWRPLFGGSVYYTVRLQPDSSRGLEVRMSFDRGMRGKLTPIESLGTTTDTVISHPSASTQPADCS
jgi:hypothetical protein